MNIFWSETLSNITGWPIACSAALGSLGIVGLPYNTATSCFFCIKPAPISPLNKFKKINKVTSKFYQR